MNLPRSSGILLHVTSLPGGRLGAEAYAFVDWLAAAGQSWWQVLPLGPPDRYGSPYTSSSAFAGWAGLLAHPEAPVDPAEIEAFRSRHPYWTDEWGRFAGRGALADQVRFEREWSALREYAAERGIRLIGDVSIYVAPRSCDHRAHPELFQRGVVAGAPPDELSASGQLWGNPLYDWHEMRAQGYRWWIERLRRTSQLVDYARIDHFRGFVSYWAVPAGARVATGGRWRRGPGAALFRAAERELGPLPLFVEDLGVITPAVHRLREDLGLAGTAVLQFGFGRNPKSPHRLGNHRQNLVVYTGTHDTNTALGWWESLSPARRRATGLDPCDPAWSMVELALSSRARIAVVQAQDVLGLGAEARMNWPGTRDRRNWRWRLSPGQLTPELAARLRAATKASQRLSNQVSHSRRRPK